MSASLFDILKAHKTLTELVIQENDEAFHSINTWVRANFGNQLLHRRQFPISTGYWICSNDPQGTRNVKRFIYVHKPTYTFKTKKILLRHSILKSRIDNMNVDRFFLENYN